MHRIILPVIFALSGFASAQEIPTVNIRVLCFQRDATGLDKLAVMTVEKKLQQVDFPESFPSRAVKSPVIEGKIYFFNPDSVDLKPIASAKIPPGMKNAFVMFFPAPATEEGPLYSTVVIDSSLKNIPEEGALVMNICKEDVRAIIGEHRIQLKPGMSSGIARPIKRNEYNMASVIFLREEDGVWEVQAETGFRFPAKQRQFFVVFPDANGKDVELRAYDLSEY